MIQFDGITWPPLRGIQDGEYKLKRTKDALEVLGNPHLQLKNIIHVAGTNGKGSVVAFTKSILNNYGHSCNIYTSPHLVKINERIAIHSENISDSLLQKYTKEVYFLLKNYNLHDTLTFFEGMTVLMFYIFSKEKADFNIIEVGLGGRFDATNVIENPLISVITSISLDHQNYLGDTYEQIAVEKCEIIKQSSYAIMGLQSNESVYEVFQKKCMQMQSRYVICKDVDTSLDFFRGTYQMHNVSLVMEVLKIIGSQLKIDFAKERVMNVIRGTKWRGRMENVTVNGKNILVDCAHNIDGISKFLEYISLQQGRKILIFGMLKRKIVDDIYTIVRGALNQKWIDTVATVNFGGEEECLQSELLANAMNHENCFFVEDFESALKLAQSYDKIFLCGSIHMVGDFFAKYNLY